MAQTTKTSSKSSKKDNAPATITPRQVQILQLVRHYRNNNGCSPTMQEMAEMLRISKVTVFEHVEMLVRKGLLRREPNRARSLTLESRAEALLPDNDAFDDVETVQPELTTDGSAIYPLAGQIAAGTPLQAIEDSDNLDLGSIFRTANGTYALAVRGDSMIEDHICDGDFVLVEPAHTARDGEVVVAVLESGDATLKRLYRETGGYRLQGANPDFPALHVSELQVRGRVIGVIRRY